MSGVLQLFAAVGGDYLDPVPTIYQGGSGGGGSFGYPVTPVAGDLALLVSYVANSTATVPTAVLATGYTNIQNSQLAGTCGVRMRSMFRRINGGESSVNNLMTANMVMDHNLLLLRFKKPVSTVTLGLATGNIVDGNPAAQTINTAGATGQVIVSLGAGFDAGNGSGLSVFSPAGTGFGSWSGYGTMQLRSERLAQVNNTTVDMPDRGNGNGLHSYFLNVNF